MSFIDRQLVQQCTYWAVPSSSAYDAAGDQAFSAPVILNCRWQDKTEMFIKQKGDESEIRAFVWTTTAIATDGYLYLGISSQTNPKNQSGADKVRRVDMSTDIRNKKLIFKAVL